jgi:hypothetical protein
MKVNQLLLAFLAIILVALYITKPWGKSTEKFTQEQNILAERLSEFIKTNPNFIKYLDKLVELNNTSDKLISKGIYNKFIANKNIKADDILKEL